jgi:hypothetical protein
MPKASKNPTPSDLCAKAVTSLAAGKRGYKKSDAAMDALEKLVKPGEVISIESGKLKGKKFKFSDKWEGKSRVNGGMNIRRFELEELTEP